jgi:hypothetical protein
MWDIGADDAHDSSSRRAAAALKLPATCLRTSRRVNQVRAR